MEACKHLSLLPFRRPGYGNGNAGILCQIRFLALLVQNYIHRIPVVHEPYVQRRHNVISVIIIGIDLHHPVEPVNSKFDGRVYVHTNRRYRYEIKEITSPSHRHKQQACHGRCQPPVWEHRSPPIASGLSGKKFSGAPFDFIICMDIVKCFFQSSVTQNLSPPNFSLSSRFERVRSV